MGRHRGHLEVCRVCGQVLRVVNHTHLAKHGITVEQYEKAHERKYIPITMLPSSQRASQPHIERYIEH